MGLLTTKLAKVAWRQVESKLDELLTPKKHGGHHASEIWLGSFILSLFFLTLKHYTAILSVS